MPTVDTYQKDPIHEDIRLFEIELKEKFPDLVVTSGYRPNAKTKQGNPSRHGKGEAIDIRYNPEINNYLWNTKEGVALLNKYGLGFLDESDPKTMKRTGAFGKHTHIGRDNTLVPITKQRYKELWGEEYVQQPQGNINSQPTNFDSDDTFTNFEDATPNYSGVVHTRIGNGLPNIIESEEKTTSKEQENTSKEKEALLQKQKEHQFIQDYLNGSIEKEMSQRRQEAPQQKLSQLDPLQEYEEISSFIENPIMQQGGQIPTSKNGVFDSNGKPVVVPSNQITMKNVDYPILGISKETGERKIMLPNVENYFFKNTENVLEIPMMQQGGEYLGNNYKGTEDQLILDYMINDISHEKGGNAELYHKLKDSIAYHESGHTMNPKAIQRGSGIGRGKYMFEGDKGSNRILTSAKRTATYFKEKNKPIPEYIQNIIEKGTGDASKLSSEQQDILFFGDLRMGNLDLKDYVDEKITLQDLWADYWWKGNSKDKDKRISQFNTSLEKYNQKIAR